MTPHLQIMGNHNPAPSSPDAASNYEAIAPSPQPEIQITPEPSLCAQPTATMEEHQVTSEQSQVAPDQPETSNQALVIEPDPTSPQPIASGMDASQDEEPTYDLDDQEI